MLDLLLMLLWATGGLIGALPDHRYGWVLGPLVAAAWGIGAGALKLKQLLVPRHPAGYLLLSATALAVAMLGLSMNAPREAILPACAGAVGALFVLERRSAIQGHAIVTASFVAAVMGATRDTGARSLPLFVPFLVLLVLSLALVHRQWVLQRLRRAAHEGYLLAAQVPGYGGTRTGLAPAVFVVATTTTIAALALYIGVPHFRWKPSTPKDGPGGEGSAGTSGMNDKLSLGAMHDLKLDHRVALKVSFTQKGAKFRPPLPMRLRGSIVDSTNGLEWYSTVPRSARTDAQDGVQDGWVTLRRPPPEAVLQECEIESSRDLACVALPEIAQVQADAVLVDGHGVVRLTNAPEDGRFRYSVVSESLAVEPSLFEPNPRTPLPCYTNLPRRDPEILSLARQITEGADNAARKAALIEYWLQTNFEYSTEFDPQGESDPVRALLFVEKRGYCVHFAATMATMLRLLNIPCRVVQGLEGGEWNPRENDGKGAVVYRFSDAHAWVEVWLGPSAGWLPFDPTPRLHGGGEENFLDQAGMPPTTTGSDPVAPNVPRPPPRGLTPTDHLSALSLDRQRAWLGSLSTLFADAWASAFGKGVAFFAVIAFSLVFTWHLLPKHEQNRLRAVLVGAPDASTGFWDEFLTLAARAGYKPGPGETPFELAKRVEKHYPGAGRVALALYAVRFGERDAREKSAEMRPILDAMRRAQAGKKGTPESPS